MSYPVIIFRHSTVPVSLRLNFSVLNYHLFQKNCCPSPACALCDASIEDVKHYFLYCLCFAALRDKLFTSAAQLLGNR